MNTHKLIFVVVALASVGSIGCSGSQVYDQEAVFNAVAMWQVCEPGYTGFGNNAHMVQGILIESKISDDTGMKSSKGLVECQMRARSCDDYTACPATVADCSSVGLVASPYGGCVEGTCSGNSYCDGSNLHKCLQGYETIDDCSLQWDDKTVCGSTGGNPGCVKPHSYKRNCDGKVLVTVQDDVTQRFDCTVLDSSYTCLVDEGYPDLAYCDVKNPACVSGKDPETCSGSVISFCFRGKPASYDCKKSGFSGCKAESGQGARAACVK